MWHTAQIDTRFIGFIFCHRCNFVKIIALWLKYNKLIVIVLKNSRYCHQSTCGGFLFWKKLLQLFRKLPCFDYHPTNSACFSIDAMQMRQIHLYVGHITISRNKLFTKLCWKLQIQTCNKVTLDDLILG